MIVTQSLSIISNSEAVAFVAPTKGRSTAMMVGLVLGN